VVRRDGARLSKTHTGEMMDDCRKITGMISEGLDRELTWSERMRIRVHLLMCSGCSAFEKQMIFLREAMRTLAERIGGHGDH